MRTEVQFCPPTTIPLVVVVVVVVGVAVVVVVCPQVSREKRNMTLKRRRRVYCISFFFLNYQMLSFSVVVIQFIFSSESPNFLSKSIKQTKRIDYTTIDFFRSLRKF